MSKEAPTKKQLYYYDRLCKKYGIEKKELESKLEARNIIDKIITEHSTGYYVGGSNNNFGSYPRQWGISFGGNGSHNHGFTGTAHGHTFTGSAHSHTFTGTAQSTIQPYVTCYMWKRTA